METRGQDPGHGWEVYVDGLVATQGSLAALAAHLAALHGHAEDIASVERALRRLRARGTRPGGKWGTRLLRAFGLQAAVDERLRFMGTYHSRFVDLPVPLCLDLVQLWDRPPTNEARPGRTWLSLARAILALRDRSWGEASRHLATAAATGDDDPAARAEVALGRALVASHDDPAAAWTALDPVDGWLDAVPRPDAQCLRARLAGQRGWLENRAGRFAVAEALHLALPDGPDVHPFARSRRANGLAYARHRQGDDEAALAWARASAQHAGDAGHVRLRAMALLMIARVAADPPEGEDARARAARIAEALGDATLRARADVALRTTRHPE